MSSAHAELGRTPDGVREVADGVLMITRALTNSFLVATDDGLILIDAGLPRSWPYLVAALAAHRSGPDDLVSVVLTHGHFDHVGTVDRLQAGSPVALNWAIDSVRKGGTVSVMGAYGPLFTAVKFGDAMNKGLTIHTNQAPVARQWPRLLEHIRAGHVSPRELITHRIPLEHIAEGYHMVSAKIDGLVKAAILPPNA